MPGGTLQNGIANGTSASKKAVTANTYNKHNSPKKTDKLDKQISGNNAAASNNSQFNGSINGFGTGSHAYFGGGANNTS